MKRALKRKLIEGAKSLISTPTRRKMLVGFVAGSLGLVGVSLSPEAQSVIETLLTVAQVL